MVRYSDVLQIANNVSSCTLSEVHQRPTGTWRFPRKHGPEAGYLCQALHHEGSKGMKKNLLAPRRRRCHSFWAFLLCWNA